eukprot:1946198-Prymnesium_polylepis.3
MLAHGQDDGSRMQRAARQNNMCRLSPAGSVNSVTFGLEGRIPKPSRANVNSRAPLRTASRSAMTSGTHGPKRAVHWQSTVTQIAEPLAEKTLRPIPQRPGAVNTRRVAELFGVRLGIEVCSHIGGVRADHRVQREYGRITLQGQLPVGAAALAQE